MKNEEYREFLMESTDSLTLAELHAFSQLYTTVRKQKFIAYLLWFIGGGLGFHRLYLRDYKGAIILAIITMVTLGIGAIVGFIDVINISKRTNRINKTFVLPIIKEVKKL
jgi:TM2 domain-containing membrane protein YozV